MPEAAVKLRDENIHAALGRHTRRIILETLEELMRQNPYGRAFHTAGQMQKLAEEMHSDIDPEPQFQVCFYFFYIFFIPT